MPPFGLIVIVPVLFEQSETVDTLVAESTVGSAMVAVAEPPHNEPITRAKTV